MNNLNFFNKSSRRKFLKILGVSMLGSLGYGIFNTHKNKINKSYWEGSVLGAPSKVEIHSKDEKLNSYLINEIDKLVFKYENTFNLQNNNSEINYLNKNKVIKNPSLELLEVVRNSIFVSEKTNGLFDITVQPLWDLYFNHFIKQNKNHEPDKNKIKDTLKLVDWKNVVVDENKIILNNKASITLNGIAQGWITDKITKMLSNYGFTDTLVDFGENYASGMFEKTRPWNILIKGKDAKKVINVSNKAIATSGGYGTTFEPTMEYHHIFNTKTGKSSNNFKAVSIVSNKAWLSDAISTASLSMNKSTLKELCNSVQAKAIIQENDNFVEI